MLTVLCSGLRHRSAMDSAVRIDDGALPLPPSQRSPVFIDSLLLALREGLEASLIVGLIVAYLLKVRRRDLLPKLWTGVALAALVPLTTGAALTWSPLTPTRRALEGIDGSLSLVAAVLMSTLILRMGRSARTLKRAPQSAVLATLAANSAGWGAVWLAALSVGREALASAQLLRPAAHRAIDGGDGLSATGVIGGLGLGILLGWAVCRGARRIDRCRFFTWIGALLIPVAAGITSYGVGDLQAAGVLPGFFSRAWDLGALLPPEHSPLHWLVVLAQAVFRFDLEPTTLQVLTWAVYLVTAALLFRRQVRAAAPARLLTRLRG